MDKKLLAAQIILASSLSAHGLTTYENQEKLDTAKDLVNDMITTATDPEISDQLQTLEELLSELETSPIDQQEDRIRCGMEK